MALLTAQLTHGNFGITITDNTENKMQIDIPENQGGTGKGMRPMQTLLAALCGCSTVDIVSILKKQKQQITDLKFFVDGEREKDKELAVWENIQLVVEFEGTLEPNKAFRAVKLSIDKYCSVAETLRRAGANITFKVFVNGVEATDV